MTMGRRSITDSVSVGEMMHMREVLGLSNGEIAKKVGCCTNTVIRMIGPHPEGKRAKRKVSRPLPPPKNWSTSRFGNGARRCSLCLMW